MNLAAHLLASVILVIPIATQADETELNIGRAAGAYVLSADFQQLLARSECSYAFKKLPLSPSVRISEVLATVPKSNRTEAKRFFDDSEDYREMKASFTKLITDTLEKTRSEGLDRNTACGMLIGFAATNELKATRIWTDYVKKSGAR